MSDEDINVPVRAVCYLAREDEGTRDILGSFRCLLDGCGWRAEKVHTRTALRHVARDHPGYDKKIVRDTPIVKVSRSSRS